MITERKIRRKEEKNFKLSKKTEVVKADRRSSFDRFKIKQSKGGNLRK